MINSLNFHGIIGKIFDVEVFKGFMHIKYLEYFSTEADFQRNIDREHIKNIMSDVSYSLDDYTFYGHSFTNAIPSFNGSRINLVYNDSYDDMHEYYHLDIDEQLFLYGSDEAIKKLVHDTIIKLKTEESSREARNVIDSYLYNRDIYKVIETYINDNQTIDSYRDSERLIEIVSEMIKNK